MNLKILTPFELDSMYVMIKSTSNPVKLLYLQTFQRTIISSFGYLSKSGSLWRLLDCFSDLAQLRCYTYFEKAGLECETPGTCDQPIFLGYPKSTKKFVWVNSTVQVLSSNRASLLAGALEYGRDMCKKYAKQKENVS